MADKNQTELQNFFTTIHDMNSAKSLGEPLSVYLEELETLAQYTSNDVLRTRARQAIEENTAPETATA